MIDTLFFDLDDTLVAFEAVSDLSWRQACASYLADGDSARAEAIHRTIRKHSNQYWSDEERSRAGRQDIVAARRMIVTEAFVELKLPEEDAIRVADFFSRVRLENMYLLPNTAETLTYFRERGLKMALLTNGDSGGQRAKIARFNLEPFFDPILIEGELGYGKPDRRVFMLALAQLGSSPEQTLMIGDNLVWDIGGAQAAGISAVWFNWKKIALPQGAQVEPFAVITDLVQLREIVERG